jgi:RNA polymerase sigma-70 factor (ECF subfamily)
MGNEPKKTDQPPSDEKAESRYKLDENVQLMLRFQAGDSGAFDELVERNIAGVHSLAFRFLGDASMVEDIAQEAFLRVFRNAKNYQPRAKFTTWLYRIVANLCFNVSRSRKKGKPISLDAVKEGDASRDVPDTHLADPKNQLGHAELGEHIAKAIAELPDQQRMAFILHQYQQNSYADIAEEMGTTPTAVKSLLSRGRANLREKLERYLKD